MGFRRPAEFGTPVRRATRRGLLWATPPSRPPLHPPRSTPKERLSITPEWRGQRGFCSGSFLPSAPRKCQMAHLLWIKSVSAEYHTFRCTLETWPCPKPSRPQKGISCLTAVMIRRKEEAYPYFMQMKEDRQSAMPSSLPFSGVDHSKSSRKLFSIFPQCI